MPVAKAVNVYFVLMLVDLLTFMKYKMNSIVEAHRLKKSMVLIDSRAIIIYLHK